VAKPKLKRKAKLATPAVLECRQPAKWDEFRTICFEKKLGPFTKASD
jgi:hypothetical protein